MDLNYVGAVACGAYTALESNRAKVLTRLTELAPIGTNVMVVRSTSMLGSGNTLTPRGYVYLAANTADASAPLETTAGATTTTTTSPAQAKAKSSTDSDVLLN
ncbi:hypothetical protein AXA44_09485 [Rhodococcus sp. SC4]|nr:hypothetical protein AXA44_09485 [Rhodococcus sp. SC4]